MGHQCSTEMLNLQMRTEGEHLRFLELQLNDIIYNKQEFRVATIRDVTESQKLAHAEANARMVNQLTSSVSHEVITPLKCIISFATSLQKGLVHSQ